MFRSARRGGVSIVKLMRTGASAAMQYGQAITGVSNTLLRKQRVTTVGMLGHKTAGGSVDMTALVADGAASRKPDDPAFEAHAQPICIWALAIWQKWVAISEFLEVLR